VHLDTNILRDC